MAVTAPPLNPVLNEILRTNQVRSAEGESLPLHSAVSEEAGRFLQELILEVRPSVSLEIGLAFGVSALFICDALKQIGGKRHLVIDPDQEGGWRSIGLLNLERAGYRDLVTCYHLPSHRALPRLEAEGIKVDFAFIDGWHTFDHTLVDCFYVDKLLRVGGMLVLDDVDSYPSVHKVCRFLLTNRSYRVRGCSNSQQGATATLKRRLLYSVARRSRTARRLLKPEWVQPSTEMGIAAEGRCIGLKKMGEDVRRWDAHEEF